MYIYMCIYMYTYIYIHIYIYVPVNSLCISWAIICALVPVISDIVVAELAVEEGFSDRLFPHKKFSGAVWIEHFPISDGWDVGSSSKYVDPIRRAYEVIVFTELMTDVHHLVVEVISPTFC